MRGEKSLASKAARLIAAGHTHVRAHTGFEVSREMCQHFTVCLFVCLTRGLLCAATCRVPLVGVKEGGGAGVKEGGGGAAG